MPQDAHSGGLAARWGRETARRLALAIGASDLANASNECLVNGMKVVIHCAAPQTKSVSVTYKMLERLDAVIGAFQMDDGSFQLWELTPAQVKAAMRETASKGPSAGRVGIVARITFEQQGRDLGRMKLE